MIIRILWLVVYLLRHQITMAERIANINRALTADGSSRLQLIRNRTKLDTQQLKDLLFSEGAFNRHIRPIFEYINSNQHIYSQHNLQSFSLQQQRKESTRMALNNLKRFKVDIKKQPEVLPFVRYATGSFDLGVNTKASVHYMLYVNSLLLFGSNQKHDVLYERAIAAEDLGCFGLTEFHHGSYSKGIQTTATYNHASKELVLSTHGTKGMKYWIGGAAESATMCVIWAQLIVDGVSEGPHPFVLPLRCAKTHKILPGLKIGDCGPKNGGNGIDNGYIIVQDLRIPVQNLLGRYGWIDGQGKYGSVTKDKDRRFGIFMTALSTGRGIISLGANGYAINALTIALRYACSRKQFQNNAKDDEITIIDYPITQLRVIPHFAATILQIIGGTILSKLYYQKDRVYMTDPSFAAQLHAMAAAVKSKYTTEVRKVVAQCRTILGGHGYSALSAISKLYHSSDVNTTWEGDNNVLLQQTTKFLIKTIGNKQKTKILDLTFVNAQEAVNEQSIQEKLRSVHNLELMFKDLLRIKYKMTKAKIEQMKNIFNKEEADYNLHPEAGNSLSLTYADYFTFTVTLKKITQAKNPQVRAFLEKCLLLWGFVVLQKERYGSHDLRKAIQGQIIALSEELVDQSVIVTDAIAPSSFVIGSPFADFNGQGFKQYLNILYTKENAFSRCHYYQTLTKANELAR